MSDPWFSMVVLIRLPIGCRSSSLLRLKLLKVIVDEVPLLAVTKTRTKLILVHLGQSLIEVPVIVSEAIHGSHHAGAMPSARAVYEELASRGIINHFQKLVNLFHAGIALILHGNVDVAKSSGLGGGLFLVARVVSQINDGLHAKIGEGLEVFILWTSATIETV